MTGSVVVMIIIGIVFIFASYFISESFTSKETSIYEDLMTVKEDYKFSDREIQIIKRKIEDVIAEHAKEIIYETNESLSNMANEKTLALGDYAVTVCEEIERNHKEVMFLYSMLDDKQKEIMKTVESVNTAEKALKEAIIRIQVERDERKRSMSEVETVPKASAIDQLTALKKKKEQMSQTEQEPVESKTEAEKPEPVLSDEEQKKEQAAREIEALFEKNTVEEEETLLEEEDLSEYEDVFEEASQDGQEDTLEDEFENTNNLNDIILEMYQNGNNIVYIARELGLGVGEVKLVIDLYQGA